ncbi:hypothetical protein [Alcaligenes faecalis]|uniref:hypothetical protein n=1 Tax=Alcaligenes faecalis TaxID=511 RepID=UPI0005AAEBF9|nr:hypothetical protein [Alcaligenes faecalis]ATH99124.1 hypothetical protein CPY64_04980 [Alcaligenes faecalis]AYZ91911.1 hypothetical protein EGY22_10750 [Alcaligenes faecalis]MCX5595626.1 hypothetical protein [Alcaligenes faecalis]QQC32279.1 hypothetical protein I6H81_16895 [Alcaligenes faecalis]CAJ0900192.1 Recombinase [Alcaligenes faecalis subsp. faecalis]
MPDKNLVALYKQAVDRFVNAIHRQFKTSNRLADHWGHFESHFREIAEQNRVEIISELNLYDRHSKLRVKITERLSELLEDDGFYQVLMAVEKRKERLSDIIAKLDYDIWFVRFFRLRTNVIIYLLEAEQDDFLKEEDRHTYERFRNRQRAHRNPIYWRGAGTVIMEPTEDVVALRYLRDSDTAIMTRHAGALHATFERLKNDAHGILNYFNKLEFFGCLGTSVKDVIDRNPEADEQELVLAALRGIKQLLAEWSRRYLHPGTLNVVDEEKLMKLTAEARYT